MAGLERVTTSYTGGVNKWIAKNALCAGDDGLFVCGTFFLFKNKPTGFIPTEDEKRLMVTYEMPEGTSTTRSIEMLLELQRRIKDIPAVYVAGGLAGLNILTFSSKSNAGTMFVNLKTMG